jgi:intracellular multiplication protein IcmK
LFTRISLGACLMAACLPVRSGAESPPETTPPGHAAETAIPLTPEMIRELGRRYGATERAKEDVTTQQASPVSRRVNVAYVPGQATSIVNTVKGYATALSFFDNTGQPWPVQWDTNSNPALAGSGCAAGSSGGPSVAAVGFYVCTPVKGSNVLEITPASIQPRGSLLVTLEGAPKPLAFLLVAGGSRYDAEISVSVAERGPNAKIQIVTHTAVPDTGAPFLTGMLEGIPPADATPLSVAGVSPDELRAWRLGDHVYLRTRYTMLSPEWTASEAGEGGLTVYAVPETPVVLLSANGRTVSAALKEP